MSAWTLWMAEALAPLLSMVIFSGKPCRPMARSRNHLAAAWSRWAMGGEQDVDGVAVAVDCSLQVFPLAGHFDVGFVHPASWRLPAFAPAKHFGKHRQDFERPAMHRGVIDEHAAFLHYLFDVAKA